MKLMKAKREVTLLLPVYNEAKTIENVVLEFYRKIGKKIPLEIMIVEDGSTDGTKDILLRLSRKIPVKLFLGEERKGYSKALVVGLKKVTTKFVVCVDSDGQHLPGDFWKLFRYRNKYDIVSGWRVKRADSTHRRLMSFVFQRLAKLFFGLPYKDITGPYKLIKTTVAQEIAREVRYMKESFWTEFTIRAHNKSFKILEVPVRHRKTYRSTNVYLPFKIPKIVLLQFIGLLKLWLEEKA